MKNQVVGIDISKDTLDFCVMNTDTVKATVRGALENRPKAIVKWLGQFDRNQVVFALEHTGHYGSALAHYLTEGTFVFYMVNPLELKKSLGIQRGKSDIKDAFRIAEYTITNKHKLTPFRLPTKSLSRLKALVTARERYVKMSVQVQNSIKANQILNKTVDVKILLVQGQAQYRSIRRNIKAIDLEIHTIMEEDQSLKNNYEKITQVIGVGPVIATKCIVETDNFSKFENPRKFSCHCGLAPFPYQSGSSIKGRTKTHYLRDKSLKAVLTKGAITAIQHDPQIKTYYNRKIAEGKHHMSVKNAVANKLVLRIFAVIKRNEPFVKLVA